MREKERERERERERDLSEIRLNDDVNVGPDFEDTRIETPRM